MSNLLDYAREQLTAAIAAGDTHLDLSGLGLTELPDQIGEALNLTHLSLRDNELISLPAALGRLAKLQQLSCANNQLQTVPDELADMTSLTTLNLKNNRLEALPEGILRLTELENLQLAGNPLPLPPEVIARWNRPQEIIAIYRQMFPPQPPLAPPPLLLDIFARYFTREDILILADTLVVPPEHLTASDHRRLADQFVAYHVLNGLSDELRELLQIWVPHLNWTQAIYELDQPPAA